MNEQAKSIEAKVVDLASVTLKPPRRRSALKIEAIALQASKLPPGKALLLAPGTYQPHWVQSFRRRGLMAGIDDARNLVVGPPVK